MSFWIWILIPTTVAFALLTTKDVYSVRQSDEMLGGIILGGVIFAVVERLVS